MNKEYIDFELENKEHIKISMNYKYNPAHR